MLAYKEQKAIDLAGAGLLWYASAGLHPVILFYYALIENIGSSLALIIRSGCDATAWCAS